MSAADALWVHNITEAQRLQIEWLQGAVRDLTERVERLEGFAPKRCHNCNGHGTARVDVSYGQSGSLAVYTCAVCGGSGVER